MWKVLFFSLLMSCGVAGYSVAQPFNPAGIWMCTVNAHSNNPSGNYGLEVTMQVGPSGELVAQGVVLYHQLANNIQNVQGYGDWTWLPPGTEAKEGLFKFRMQPQNHAIITWFASPIGPGRMYNLFKGTRADGTTANVETQCQQTG